MKAISCVYLSTDTDTESGLFKSQVLSLEERAPEGFDLKIVNVCNVNRWMNRPPGLPNIMGFPMRYANSVVGVVFIYFSAIFAALQIAIRYEKADVIVARGYYGGLIGVFLMLIGKKFIWDPRSVYPLEMLGKGFFSRRSFAFRFWVWVEGRIARRASSIFVVSVGHRKYMSRLHRMYNKRSKACTLEIMPCYASSDYSEVSDKNLLSFLNGSSSDKPTVCYIGSLDHGWNNIAIYTKIFSEILAGGNRLLVLTQSIGKKELLRCFDCVPTNAEAERFYVTEVKEIDEQMAVLRRCDYGVMFMRKVPDWFTRISVKFAMYRCAGLPVIINKYFGGALQVLRNQKDFCSRIIENENDKLEGLERLPESTRESIIEGAAAMFSQRNFYSGVYRVFEKCNSD